MKTFKPMLAGECPEIDKLSFPVLCSPKYDGIRCVIRDGKALTRSLKPIPNKVIARTLEDAELCEGMDGELMVRGGTFQDATHAVMSPDADPGQWVFVVFDYCYQHRGLGVPFHSRYHELRDLVAECQIDSEHLETAPQVLCNTAEFVRELEGAWLEVGHEGVMIRDPNSFYKFGRSTTKGGELLKLKRFTDSEAEIIGFVELMHNANEAFTNELGKTKRSTKKAGKVPAGKLGALQVRDIHTGVEFEIGTGFTDEQRQSIWDDRYTGLLTPFSPAEIVKYKFQAHGVKDKPRCPVFLGFRDARDL